MTEGQGLWQLDRAGSLQQLVCNLIPSRGAMGDVLTREASCTECEKIEPLRRYLLLQGLARGVKHCLFDGDDEAQPPYDARGARTSYHGLVSRACCHLAPKERQDATGRPACPHVGGTPCLNPCLAARYVSAALAASVSAYVAVIYCEDWPVREALEAFARKPLTPHLIVLMLSLLDSVVPSEAPQPAILQALTGSVYRFGCVDHDLAQTLYAGSPYGDLGDVLEYVGVRFASSADGRNARLLFWIPKDWREGKTEALLPSGTPLVGISASDVVALLGPWSAEELLRRLATSLTAPDTPEPPPRDLLGRAVQYVREGGRADAERPALVLFLRQLQEATALVRAGCLDLNKRAGRAV
jgi:hypothetical protein